MDWWAIILGAIFFGLWAIPLAYELISAAISDCKRSVAHNKEVKKANEEYRKTHPPRTRRLCTKCSYCRWKWDHAFSYGPRYWEFAQKLPYYCKKFNTPLKRDALQTCISELDSKAMYEKD